MHTREVEEHKSVMIPRSFDALCALRRCLADPGALQWFRGRDTGTTSNRVSDKLVHNHSNERGCF